MSADNNGFMSRWSRRKVRARSGAPVGDALTDVQDAAPERTEGGEPAAGSTAGPDAKTAALARPQGADRPAAGGGSGDTPADDAQDAGSPPNGPSTHVRPAAPTMDDVAQLTHTSDYSRYVSPGVDGGVRNAAMKKLFSDPHFNVMDGLDTYIDDYGKPDPLPESMLRKMAQADFLNLFPEDRAKRLAERAAAERERVAALALPDDAAVDTGVDSTSDRPASLDLPASHKDSTLLPDDSTARSGALPSHEFQAAAPAPAATTEPAPHEDTDLRLQPDDAAGRRGPGQGPRR